MDDLFQNLENEDSSTRYFVKWSYDATGSINYPEVRSGINFSNTTVYDLLKSLEENYQVFIEFNTLSRTIRIKERFSGSNNGLRFEYGKYLTGVSQSYNTEELITYMQGQDGNNIGFADVS